MFLSTVGFICLLAALCFISVAYFLVALDGLGKWNIGGVENSKVKKFTVSTLGLAIGWSWYALFAYGPLYLGSN